MDDRSQVRQRGGLSRQRIWNGSQSDAGRAGGSERSEEHTSELSHRTISYAVFCLKKKTSLRLPWALYSNACDAYVFGSASGKCAITKSSSASASANLPFARNSSPTSRWHR